MPCENPDNLIEHLEKHPLPIEAEWLNAEPSVIEEHRDHILNRLRAKAEEEAESSDSAQPASTATAKTKTYSFRTVKHNIVQGGARAEADQSRDCSGEGSKGKNSSLGGSPQGRIAQEIAMKRKTPNFQAQRRQYDKNNKRRKKVLAERKVSKDPEAQDSTRQN